MTHRCGFCEEPGYARLHLVDGTLSEWLCNGHFAELMLILAESA